MNVRMGILTMFFFVLTACSSPTTPNVLPTAVPAQSMTMAVSASQAVSLKLGCEPNLAGNLQSKGCIVRIPIAAGSLQWANTPEQMTRLVQLLNGAFKLFEGQRLSVPGTTLFSTSVKGDFSKRMPSQCGAASDSIIFLGVVPMAGAPINKIQLPGIRVKHQDSIVGCMEPYTVLTYQDMMASTLLSAAVVMAVEEFAQQLDKGTDHQNFAPLPQGAVAMVLVIGGITYLIVTGPPDPGDLVALGSVEKGTTILMRLLQNAYAASPIGP